MVNILPILLKRLSFGQSLSTEQLSKEFNVPSKTIQDNINKHLKKLYPENILFSKSTNMWYSNKNFLADTLLTAEEIVTIDLLEEHSKGFGKEFNTLTKRLFNRFKRRASFEIYKKTNFEKVNKEDNPTFALIKNSIQKKQTIRCKYNNKYRIVYPLKIVMFDGYWYALVLDNSDNKLKTFHLKSIQEIEYEGTQFNISDQNIIDKLDNAINANFKDKDPVLVELEIHKEIAKYFHRRPLSKNQILRKSTHQDYEIMSIFITDFMEIIPTIQQFLPFIKVVSPNELDTEIRKHLLDYDATDLTKYFKAN